MAANRSRTAGWRQSLQQLKDRQAPIEIAVWRGDAYAGEDVSLSHLMWRVRLLDVADDGLVIEQPSAMGQSIPLQDGVKLVALYAVGQNRWTFFSNVIKSTTYKLNRHRSVEALHLSLPTSVERCRRRKYIRVEAPTQCLPAVDVWPLLDPKSVVVAERANELEFLRALNNETEASGADAANREEIQLPAIGPMFSGRLDNIGGGGVGLRFDPDQTSWLNSHKLFWMRFNLPPEMPAPLCVTGKLTHTHIESMQTTYAGVAFDFTFNPSHQRFVTEQICGYVARQQSLQLDGQCI